MTVLELVDRGVVGRAGLERVKNELKGIEARLQKYGLAGEHVELKDAEREGRRWLAHGSKLIVPVVFTADKIVGSFKSGSPVHERIDKAAEAGGREVEEFFAKATTYENLYEDGKRFRAVVEASMGGQTGPPFITACLAVGKFGIPKAGVEGCLADGEEVSGLKSKV